ncbi:hypothetical protein [uncultured Nocardioides sp.]|uniref:hypothetical protein n=1 Tax=uncultured Nocardioides sp. TaxID=198441 RepID=UPI002626A843|nr:hypothetical protein [uncultured Nocardioides sp.]
MTTAGAELRWLRAAVVATVATSLGVIAHVLAGGLLPSWPGLVVILAVVMVVAAAALGRPASYPVIAGLVAGGQTGVHLLLTATAGHGSPHAPTASSGTMSPASTALSPASMTTADGAGGYARVMRQVPSGVEGAGAPPHWVQHLLDDMTGLNALMALGHLVAAALVSVWLWKGEQAVWGLMALLGARVRSRMEMACRTLPASMTTLPHPARGVTSTAVSHVRALRSPVAGTTSRRGPPLGRAPSLLTSPSG